MEPFRLITIFDDCKKFSCQSQLIFRKNAARPEGFFEKLKKIKKDVTGGRDWRAAPPDVFCDLAAGFKFGDPGFPFFLPFGFGHDENPLIASLEGLSSKPGN